MSQVRTPVSSCLTLGATEGGRRPSLRPPDPQQSSEPLSAPQRVWDPVRTVLPAPPPRHHPPHQRQSAQKPRPSTQIWHFMTNKYCAKDNWISCWFLFDSKALLLLLLSIDIRNIRWWYKLNGESCRLWPSICSISLTITIYSNELETNSCNLYWLCTRTKCNNT